MTQPDAKLDRKPVSQEARQRMSRAQRSRHLTARQERFVKAYAYLGNGSEAARRAGYKPGPRVGQIAVENLQKPAIVSALKQELARIELQISPERVQRRLDEISHEAQSAGQFGPAVRAEELLGRSVGMFIDRSIHLSGTINDSHIGALLEIARRRQQEPIDLADDAVAHSSSTHDDSEDR
jgi:Terminase small subunit